MRYLPEETNVAGGRSAKRPNQSLDRTVENREEDQEVSAHRQKDEQGNLVQAYGAWMT